MQGKNFTHKHQLHREALDKWWENLVKGKGGQLISAFVYSDYLFLCVWLFSCMHTYVHDMHVWCPQRSVEGAGFSGTRVRRWMVSCHLDAGKQTHVFCKSTKGSEILSHVFQPHIIYKEQKLLKTKPIVT